MASEDAHATFTCDNCGRTFETDWTDEEAKAEYEAAFGKPFDPETAVVVCDDCFKRLNAIYN